MADISFYKYLEAAFRFRLRDPRGQRATPSTRFPYLGYNLPFGTSGAEKGIFYYARKVLPFAYTNEFPDTEEGNLQMAKAVLDRLDKEERPLEAYVDKTAVTQEVYNLIADEARQQSAQAEAGQTGGAPQPGEPAGTMSEGSSGPGLPSLGTAAGTSAARRVIRVAPPTKPPSASETVPGLRNTPETGLDYEGKPYAQAPSPVKATQAPGNRFQAPRIPSGVTNIGKNFTSKASIFLNRNIIPIARTGLGAFAGGVLTGGNPLGILGGGVGGATVNAWGRKVLNGTINAAERFSSQISRGGLSFPGGKKKELKIALLFLGLFFFVALGTAFTVPGTPGTGTTGGTGSTGGPGGSCPTQAEINTNKQDPSTCHYFGLGVNLFDTNIPPAAIDKYRNDFSGRFISHGGTLEEFNRRLEYLITESRSAGINPVLLMGYWRTENDFPVANGRRDMGCATDSINFEEQVDCALGIKAYSNPVKNPVANCAKSKDSNSEACRALKNNRTNSGLDRNNPINYPISTFDDFAEAHGSRDPGLNGPGTVNNNCKSTYNQLVEIAESLNACKVSTGPSGLTQPGTPGVRPTAPVVDPSNLRASLISKFGVTMNGYDSTHLQWAWEKLWDVSNTNFIKFVKGSVILAIDGTLSEQVGCPGQALAVKLHGYSSEELFKYALTHELGHVIWWCSNSLNNYYKEHENAFAREGGVTYYAKHAAACTGANNRSEDYAEMIAVYLNPTTNIQIAKCAPAGSKNPNLSTDFPLHYNVAKSILGDY